MRRLPLVALLTAASFGLSLPPIMPTQAATARTVTIRTYAAYPQAGGETTLAGTVTNSPDQSPVDIQEFRAGTWTNLGQARSDASGSYAFLFVPVSGGQKYYRAVVPETTNLTTATSATVTFYLLGVPKTTFDDAPAPTFTGSLTVGSVLTARTGTWSPNEPVGVQWVRDGKPLRAYSPYYRLTSQDFGKVVTVATSALRSGARTIRESKPGPPVGSGTFTTKPPVISGEAKVGGTVEATASRWTPEPTTVTYQWERNGVIIDGATGPQYTVTADDAGSDLSVDERGEGEGLDPATRTSATVPVAGILPASDETFGDRMRPRSTQVLASSDGSFQSGSTPAHWGPNTLTRWDAPGAFTHSLDPKAVGTLYSDYYGHDISWAPNGAEYVSSNSSFKNADVEFEFTGSTFAIEYRTYTNSDAMVWIDDQPVSAAPIIGRDGSAGRTGSRYFITVTLPDRRTVKVRFAGPLSFAGVHSPTADHAVIKASPPPFTLGVIGDSYYESCRDPSCQSRSAAPMLSTLTGFRVWNLAEGSTGYINDGSGLLGKQAGTGSGVHGHESSPFGSARHVDAIRKAPIDALLINGSANDRINWTTTEHRAAVERFLTDLEQARPDLPVVIVGVEPVAYTKNRSRTAYYGAQTATFAGLVGRHRNLVGFIDPYTDPWFTADNYAQYLGVDGSHPNGDGQAYYQGRITDELAKLPLPVAP